jgi:hypothetical protein
MGLGYFLLNTQNINKLEITRGYNLKLMYTSLVLNANCTLKTLQHLPYVIELFKII